MDSWFLDRIACPRDHEPLVAWEDRLVCPHGHAYPCVDGIPVLLMQEAAANHSAFARTLAQVHATEDLAPDPIDDTAPPADDESVDLYVQQSIEHTNGLLYHSLRNALSRYPIPSLPLPPGNGSALVDVGCNWGRWSLAAARAGYRVIGIDPDLDAIRAATRVARQMGVAPAFIVGDARHLPLRDGALDVAFSYSVLQHFAVPDALQAIAEMGRVLRPHGEYHVQLANALGVRNLSVQARRGFRRARAFEVRYWSPWSMRRAFDQSIGPAALRVDGFFSLNPQSADLDLLPNLSRLIVRTSDTLRRVSKVAPVLTMVADSIFVSGRRTPLSDRSARAPHR